MYVYLIHPKRMMNLPTDRFWNELNDVLVHIFFFTSISLMDDDSSVFAMPCHRADDDYRLAATYFSGVHLHLLVT